MKTLKENALVIVFILVFFGYIYWQFIYDPIQFTKDGIIQEVEYITPDKQNQLAYNWNEDNLYGYGYISLSTINERPKNPYSDYSKPLFKLTTRAVNCSTIVEFGTEDFITKQKCIRYKERLNFIKAQAKAEQDEIKLKEQMEKRAEQLTEQSCK